MSARILDDMARNPAKYGAKGKQIGDFYASWMDEAAIEKRGAAVLKPYLAKIGAVQNLTELQVLFASGVEMAYAAYRRYQAKHGPAPVIGGLTATSASS